MSKWFVKLEWVAIVDAPDAEKARDTFEREFGVRPGEYDTVTRIDDGEPADLIYEEDAGS